MLVDQDWQGQRYLTAYMGTSSCPCHDTSPDHAGLDAQQAL